MLSTRVTPAPDGAGTYTDYPPEGTHDYEVSSLDLAGNESALTDPTVTSKATPPAAPVNLAASLNAFGNVQLYWEAGSTEAVTYRLYRTTFSIASLEGLAYRVAVATFVETPAQDGTYHYAVSAVDSVGNESTPSNEAVLIYDKAAPVILITAVADGGYYNSDVVPVFSASDGNLDPGSVRGVLDGQPFLSGQTVSAEGGHGISVTASDLESHSSTRTLSFIIDKTPPAVGVSGVAEGAVYLSSVSAQIVVSDLHPGTSFFTLVNLTLGTTSSYVPGEAISRDGFHRLTASAVDLAGNASTREVSFRLDVAPIGPTGLTVHAGKTASLAWTKPEPDVIAYRVYRDGQRISSSLHQAASFEDAAYSAGVHVYEVSAVDSRGEEGPKARATVPAVSIGISPLTLTRGFFDAVRLTASNSSPESLDIGPATLELQAEGLPTVMGFASAISVAAGRTGALSGVLAVPPNLPASVTLTASVAAATDPGAAVYLEAESALSVADPKEPIVEAYPDVLVPGTESPVQVRLYNRGSAPLDVVTAQVVNSTYAAVEDVGVELETPEGMTVAWAGLKQTGHGAAATFREGRQVFFVRVPPGESYLFDPVRVLVPETAYKTLVVAASVSTPTYSLPYSPVAGTRGFSSALSQAVVEEVPYRAEAFADRSFYDQGSSVTLAGRAIGLDGRPLADTAVMFHVVSNGYDRHVYSQSDSSGNCSAVFNPMPNEAGGYSLSATHPSVVSHPAQSSFTIVGFGYQYSAYEATLAENSSYNFTVELSNTGSSALGSLTASTASLSGTGVSLSLDPASLPSSLAAGAKAVLPLTLSAAPGAAPATASLTVREAHGFTRTLPVSAAVVPAQVIPTASPQLFQLGMFAGEIRTQVITLENKGFDTWRDVELTTPAFAWVHIQGLMQIGDIAPGKSASFTLSFEPPAGLMNQSVDPSPMLQVLSANASALAIRSAVAITSVRKGDVLISAIDADKPRNYEGLGVGLPGATATLISLAVPGLSYTATADLNGLSRFEAVPSGNYAWRVESKGYQTRSGTVVIEPGLVNKIEAVLPTAVVTYEWKVTPTMILDKYYVSLNLTFRTDVPAPALVVSPLSAELHLEVGQTAYTQYTVTNKGMVSAVDFTITPAADDGLELTVPFNTIPEIKPGQSVTVPVKVRLVHASPCEYSGRTNHAAGYNCPAGGKQDTGVGAWLVKVIRQALGCPTTGGTGDPRTTKPTGSPKAESYTYFTGDATPSQPGAKGNLSCGGAGPTHKGPPCGCDQGGGANAATGAVSKCGTGPEQAGQSPRLGVQPGYDSSDPQNSPYGYGWHGDIEPKLEMQNDGSVKETSENGAQHTFVPLASLSQPMNGDGPYFAQPIQHFAQLSPKPGAPLVCSSGASECQESDKIPSVMQRLDKDGTVKEFSYYGPNKGYLLAKEADRNGSATRYERDSNGRLLKATDVHGRTLSFSYNGQGKVASIADGTGRSTTYDYDASGNKTRERDTNNDPTEYAYDANHRLTQITFPNGGHRYFTYNGQAKVIEQKDDDDNNKETFQYYASSTSVTDALGRMTVHHWVEKSGLRVPSRIVDPLGHETVFEYDTGLNLVKQSDALGRITRFQYDSMGNVTATTDPAGKTTQVSYEPNYNQATQVIDPKGNKTQMTYDGKGNLVQVSDAANNMTRMSYDSQGHVVQTKDPQGNVTSFGYDDKGALAAVTDSLGRATQMQRGALSRVTGNTDPSGKQTDFQYAPAGEPTQVKDALNGVTAYGYQAGRPDRLLHTVTDAKSQPTTFGYDPTGRLTSVTNALNQAKSFTYDKRGNLTRVVDAKGQVIDFAYDELDRLITKTLPEGPVSYQYDAAGNLTRAANYNGSVVEMAYDAMNRVILSRQTLPAPGGFQAEIGYTYDANGNRTRMTTPWGAFSYEYDSLNRLTKVTNPQGRIFTFAYDSLGRRTRLTYPNGIETTYAYDAAGQVTQILHRRVSDNTAIAFANYTYDSAGNRTSMEDMSGVHTYGYDDLHRLISATHPPDSHLEIKSETFSYDGVGNRLADARFTGYLYDAANRITSNSSYTYTHDLNGNLTGGEDKLSLQTTSYAYDSENQLKQVSLPDGTVFTTKYDGQGRRVAKSTGTSASQTIRYVYDNEDLLAMFDGSDSLFAMFAHGPGIDEPLMIRKADGQELFIHADGLGSIVAHTDAQSNVMERIEYGTYGTAVFIAGSETSVGRTYSVTRIPYSLTGRELDSETQLLYLRRRYYSPLSGTFLSQDPGLPATLRAWATYQPYQYVANNPVRYSDPLGEVLMTPLLLPCVIPAYNEAKKELIRKYGKNINDKFKHCVVAGKLAKACGAPVAMELAYIK